MKSISRILACIIILAVTAGPIWAANPPICPHINNWSGHIASWASGSSWVKVMSKDDVVRAKTSGSRVFYRPYDVPNTDNGYCMDGIAMGNAVVANLNAIGSQNWPDAIGYRNEFNNDTDSTPKEFLKYYDTIRAAGYTGLILYGSYAVWWPMMSDWADPDVRAAVEKADGIELHEYFDLTVACQQYILCHRHVETIRQYPYVGNKPIFIGEFGSDFTNCNDPLQRRGWNDRGKLTPTQYIEQMEIYRAGCAKQVVAAFLFQQGAVGDWSDFEIMNTPDLTNYVKSTWNNLPGYATGHVRNASSQPIQGAIVTAQPIGINVVTNELGRYWLYNLPVGSCSITVSKPGYVNTSASVSITANGNTTRDFTLTSASPGAITGWVKDSNANALVGATVSTNVGGYTTTTNSYGNYTLSQVGVGTYDITASKGGFMSSVQSGKTVSSNTTTTVNFNLQSNFQGIINGNFEGGAYDNPDLDHQSGIGWNRFSLAGSSKSSVIYGGAHSPSYSQTIYEYNWTAGIYQHVPGTVIGNKYTASVWVKGTDSNVNLWIGVDPYGGTDANSSNIQWSNSVAPGGTWTQISKQVTAAANGVTVFLKAQNTAMANKNAFFDDAAIVDDGQSNTSAITGNVKNSSGQNLSGATVSTGLYSALTDSGGNYTISNVPSGTYSVTASKSGYQSSTQTGKTVNTGQTTTASFTLSPTPPGAISGNVKDGSGVNLSGVSVTTNTGGYSATTDSSGNYTISSVAAGTYDVTASKSGYVSSTQSGKTVSSGVTTTVNFTLNAAPVQVELLTNGNFNNGCTGWSHTENPTSSYWGCGNKAYPGTSAGAGGHGWNAYLACGGWFCDKVFTGAQYQDNVSVTGGSAYTASAQVYYEPVGHPGDPSDQKERIVLTFNDPAATVQASPWQTHTASNGWNLVTFTGTVPAGATKMQFKVELSHTDSQWSGTSGIDECSFLSSPPCTAPSISAHPQSQTKNVGQSVTFSVTASGTATLSYQWKKNGSNISGATSSSYTIASVTTGDAASYTCYVSNSCGNATSNAAVLVVATPVSTINEAKALADGTVVSIANKAVTASTGTAFWIEESDRSSGIKVVATNSLAPGANVTVTGTLATANGERYLNSASFTTSGTLAVPAPLGLGNAAFGGKPLSGSQGPANVGLLVRVWGKVTKVYSDSFFINDGIMRSDFSGETGLKVMSGALTEPTLNQYVTVTGVVSTQNSGGNNVPVLIPRTQSDIRVF